MKKFDEIYVESLSLNDLFIESAKCIWKISDITKEQYQKKYNLEGLKESTKFGKIYLDKINSVVDSFAKYNKTLQKRIDEYDANKENDPHYSISKSDLQHIVDLFDLTESPNILQWMKYIFNDPESDDEDKENVHRACAIYDQLYQEYSHKLHQIKLKQPNLRSITMKGFSLK